ncbi:MAG: DUF4296 domain-containing protein [bacterium]
MQTHFQTTIFLFLFIILNLHCENESKLDYLTPGQFAEIYAETVVSAIDSVQQDSLAALMQTLKKFNVTRKKFEQSVEYYNTKPEMWQLVFRAIEVELEKREKPDEN